MYSKALAKRIYRILNEAKGLFMGLEDILINTSIDRGYDGERDELARRIQSTMRQAGDLMKSAKRDYLRLRSIWGLSNCPPPPIHFEEDWNNLEKLIKGKENKEYDEEWTIIKEGAKTIMRKRRIARKVFKQWGKR